MSDRPPQILYAGSLCLEAASYVSLSFAFGAGLLLYYKSGGLLTQMFAAAGQMALSNYLAQAMIFSMLFYGFGFGLFGQLGSAITMLIGVAVYVGQLAVSYIWLRRYRFGPAEWLWRSLTYGRWQQKQAGANIKVDKAVALAAACSKC